MQSLRRRSLRAQRGFSLVEMLMTAFILAVGVMGLTLLQVMSLKGARGGKSLATAIQVGEAVMDRIEMEGRLSWLNITDSQYNVATALPNLAFVNKTTLAQPLTFNLKGQVPVTASADPAESTPFYSVGMRRVPVSALAAGTGSISDFTVTVTFADVVNPTTNAPITRTVTLTRRVLHG